MSLMGSLEIQMYADVARLRADMDQARKVVGSSMADIQRAVDLAKTAFIALAGVASVKAFAGMIGGAIEGAAALKDLQQQTGASVEALSAMGSVGKMSDTSLQTVAGAMNKLSKSMSSSNEESRGAAAAIKALGIDYDSFARLNPDQRMQAVAKAMGGFEDGADKSAAAMALFGKSGAELLPFLSDLAEQEKLVGKVSAEQAEMADRYSDNLVRLQKSGKGWEQQLAMGLLPVLDETAQALLGVMNGSGGLREQIAKLSADGTLQRWARAGVTGLSYLLDVVQYVQRGFTVLGDYIGAVAADAVQMFGGIGSAISRALAGDFSGAVDEMRAVAARSASINADVNASMEATWGAKTLGQNLRERIAEIQSVGTVAQAAKAKLSFKDTSGAAGAGAAGANPFAAEQDAAKAWAKAYEDFIKIADAAQAKTADLTKGQARLVDYLTSPAYTLASDGMRQVALQAAYAAIAVEQLGAAEAAQLKWLEESGKANADALDALDKTVLGLQAQVQAQLEANAQAGMSEIALAGLAAAKLEEAAAAAEQRAQWADTAMLGDDLVGKYRDQAAALRALADAKRGGAFAADEGRMQAEQRKAVDDYLKSSSTTDLAAGFDAASQSLGTFVQLFGKLVDTQEQYNAARTAAAGDAVALAAIEAHHQRAQINGYGSMAGAAKGFFAQHTAGYKVMEAAEKTFRALELGLAIKNAMEKIGLVGVSTAAVAAGQAGETAAVTAGEAARNTAKVPGVFMAFMSALGPWGLAAAAAAIAAVGLSAAGRAGGGGSFGAMNSGTGTVLGDPSAKSESITKSLDLLADVDQMTMRYSAQMAASLRSIDAGINGLARLIVQTTSLTATPGGVQVGFRQDAIGQFFQGDADLIKSYLGPLGGLLSQPSLGLAKRFGTSTAIDAQGITAQAQSLADIMAKGFKAQYFADMTDKDKAFGITYSTTRSTVTSAADAELQRQFGLILAGFTDTVKAAAGPLGAAMADVQARLGQYVVDIGRIDLQGLTGQEISDKLTAVFGAAGDRIAQAALPGLEQWQAIGEGYLQTVVRVGSSVERVQVTLESLGQSTAALSGTLAQRATAAMELIDAFGGLDKLQSQTGSYLEAYYSQAERTALTTRQLSAAFAGLGLTLPKTREEYRRLVDAQDLASAAGRSSYAALIGLSGAFAQITDAAGLAADAIANASSSVVDEIKRLRGLSADAGTASAAELQARFATATAQARAGGAGALSGLADISQALEAASTATSASALDAARMRAWLATSLTETLTMLGLPIPAFAAGGLHAGGLALVGEQGPELVATGPARIYNAGQTQALLSGAGGDSGAMLAELQALRAEVAGLRAESQAGDAAIASHTRRTANYLDRVIDGVDAVRTLAT